MSSIADFAPTLRKALAEIKAAGLVEQAVEAEGMCFTAYATSSEYLGGVGEALSTLLRAHGSTMPEPTKAKLRYCLAEVAKVWPKYRP